MNNNIEHFALAFEEFKKYKHEIIIELIDSLEKEDSLLLKELLAQIGSTELHYFVKYHYKIVLNALYFKNQEIVKNYQQWVYKIYHHKNIDMDFFPYYNELCKKVSSRYIEKKALVQLNKLYDELSDNHTLFLKGIKSKKLLLEENNEISILTKYLLSADIEKAKELLNSKASNIEEFLSFYSDIIYNAMKLVGYLWEDGTISVAKEHVATKTLSTIVFETLDSYPDHPINNKHIFLNCAPDELHSLGTQIAAKVLVKLGYKVTNIAPKVPTIELIRGIIDFSPDHIIFSATLPTSLIDIAFIINDILDSDLKTLKKFQIGIAGNAFENLILPAQMIQADYFIPDLKSLINYLVD